MRTLKDCVEMICGVALIAIAQLATVTPFGTGCLVFLGLLFLFGGSLDLP